MVREALCKGVPYGLSLQVSPAATDPAWIWHYSHVTCRPSALCPSSKAFFTAATGAAVVCLKIRQCRFFVLNFHNEILEQK